MRWMWSVRCTKCWENTIEERFVYPDEIFHGKQFEDAIGEGFYEECAPCTKCGNYQDRSHLTPSGTLRVD